MACSKPMMESSTTVGALYTMWKIYTKYFCFAHLFGGMAGEGAARQDDCCAQATHDRCSSEDII